MELTLSTKEIEQLKKIDFLGRGVFIKVEIDKPVIEFLKKVIEVDYKFQEALSHEPSKIEDDTLYNKLCESINKQLKVRTDLLMPKVNEEMIINKFKKKGE